MEKKIKKDGENIYNVCDILKVKQVEWDGVSLSACEI